MADENTMADSSQHNDLPAAVEAAIADLKPETMKRGGRYNWKGQPERLIYLGRELGWHQFHWSDDPKRRRVWCEVLDADLHMLEETPCGCPEGMCGSNPTGCRMVSEVAGGEHG